MIVIRKVIALTKMSGVMIVRMTKCLLIISIMIMIVVIVKKHIVGVVFVYVSETTVREYKCWLFKLKWYW